MSENKHHCSFCGKEKKDSRKLIAGNDAFICDDCVRICSDMLDEVDNVSVAEEIPLKKRDFKKVSETYR